VEDLAFDGARISGGCPAEVWEIPSQGGSSSGEIHQHSFPIVMQNVTSALRHETRIADIATDVMCIQETGRLRLSRRVGGTE
jgi:hypothetical protein